VRDVRAAAHVKMDIGTAMIVASLVPSITTLISGWWTRRQNAKSTEHIVHKMNSVLDARVSEARQAGDAAGELRERARADSEK
jgi:hypothetical protein